MQRPQRLQLALQAQRPQPLTTRPLQLLQACMKQPRPKPQWQDMLQAQRPQPLSTRRPQQLSTRPLQLLQACMEQPRPKLQMQMQMKGSQPLIRSGAVGLEIAISSRRADEIGDDVSG